MTPKYVCRTAARERITVKNMKQKYSITVADMELNIISDASPDEVENIVGILDRRMRDINLKSPRCTKNEAAVLCALSYCSERIAMQEAFKKVEKDAFRFAAENEKQKRTIETMQKEIDTLRKDAEVMRSLLDRASITPAAPQQAAAPASVPTPAPVAAEKTKYIPKPFNKPAETEKLESTVQLSAFDQIPEITPQQPLTPAPSAPEAEVEPAIEAPVEEEKVEEATPVKKATKPANKNRVGSMFDFLTFSDV